MNRAEILGIWQCADAAFAAADLESEITRCLPCDGFSMATGFDIDIVFDERRHDPESQPALLNMGVPWRIFETLQVVFAKQQGLIDALNRAAPIMSLDFTREGHFWIPSQFWNLVSGNMLSRLIEAGGTSETLLAVAFERDLGL